MTPSTNARMVSCLITLTLYWLVKRAAEQIWTVSGLCSGLSMKQRKVDITPTVRNVASFKDISDQKLPGKTAGQEL